MNESIENRRSIRKYQDAPVSRALLEQILRAGNLAPSAKNRQPWRFVVATGRGKAEAVAAMRRGLAREAETPLLPGSAQHRKGAAYTAQIMEQAPAVIFAINPLGTDVRAPRRSASRNAPVRSLCMRDPSAKGLHTPRWRCRQKKRGSGPSAPASPAGEGPSVARATLWCRKDAGMRSLLLDGVQPE